MPVQLSLRRPRMANRDLIIGRRRGKMVLPVAAAGHRGVDLGGGYRLGGGVQQGQTCI